MTTRALATRQDLIGDGTAAPPSDSARGAVWAGVAILALFFGGFGGWALMAPLNGAVVGQAVVKVDGNRKSVQHLDGGIVKELRVREGDRVKAGDVLLVLDDTEARSDFEVLAQQYAMLRATEARLNAELAGAEHVAFPADMAASGEASARTAIAGQQKEFDSRAAALEGQAAILSGRVTQLQQQIAGNDAQQAAYEQQLASVIAERESLAGLLASGLITRDRTLQLQRTEDGIRGQIGTVGAASQQARLAIGELGQQIAQLTKDRIADDTRELRDVQTRMLETAPRLDGARAVLDRMEVRAPYSGQVVDLNVFGAGAVIAKGERILDIVPEATSLVVDAQIAVEDISDVKPGMAAEVHFTSYKQRTIPLIHGTVAQVSADRLADARTGVPYYQATVAVNADELAASPEIALYPGMPATVMITTEQRTAFDYLVGPLVASFDRSFRQK